MRRIATYVGIVVAVSLLSAQLAGGVRTPQQAAAGSQPPAPAPITAPVERRVLRERITLRGVVKAPPERAFGVRSSLGSQTLVVTANPLRRGAPVAEGAAAIEVSGRPLLALAGPVPMYRDIHVGDRGRDVLQLQAALSRLGMAPGAATGVATAQTAAAMARLYRTRGYEPAAAAAPPGAAGDAGAPGDRPRDGEAERPPALVAAQSELAFAPALPARLTHAQRVGSQPSERTIALARGVPFVHATASVEQAQAVRRGRRVRLTLASGRSATGEVVRVRRMPPSAETGGATLRVSIRPRRPLPARSVGQELSVTVTVARAGGRQSGWVVVPLAAVFARADGSSSVVVLERDGRRRRVVVEAGRSIEGYVAVRPSAGTLSAGERVVVGE